MSEWLYQYWFFCFKTAKSWGKGPLAWTAQLLDFDGFRRHHPLSLPGTPRDTLIQSEELEDGPMPTNHCRWLIHVYDQGYEALEDAYIYPNKLNPNDESTWSPWPTDRHEPPLPGRLRDALEHNDFSSIPVTDLPVAIPHLAKAAQRSQSELLLESLGFSIMSRNPDQVIEIIDQLEDENIDFKSLFPFHIATSYLDGYKSCCSILKTLMNRIDGPQRRDMYVNESGYTVLDNLMISILKSHSSATPAVFDNSLKDTARFTGEEVDICGRWDADSPCVRYRLANGNPTTPFAWKHKFCHTSIQTIFHCIKTITLYSVHYSHTASGLYIRRCFDCGVKLQLQPLHSLVMTAYHLADHSCQDEDLFGMLSCLLSLITSGFDPCKTANVSFAALVESDPMEVECDHEELTPSQLAEKISASPAISRWSERVRTGWAVFCGVLRLCEDVRTKPESDVYDEDMSDDEGVHDRFIVTAEPSLELKELHLELHGDRRHFLARRDLATLWASVQAELLSYRRLDDEMSWISPRFSMEGLKTQLERGEPLTVGYAEQNLLQPHCICGEFESQTGLAKLSDATDPEIANLDIWERASYRIIGL